ncbi:MAG: TIR domain-containing protein [Sulfitobacter sp.]|nr:TIR domain-containing protein [Sulfitobacter sp.]
MSTLFISHSSADADSAQDIFERLGASGYESIFLDFDEDAGIAPGSNWERELHRNLKSCSALVFLCSKSSAKSNWCFAEVIQARSMGKQSFVLKLDDCTAPAPLDRIQFLDYTGDPDVAFARLLKGLQRAGLDPGDDFGWKPGNPPYPGLNVFDESDAAVYFGRSDEIRQALDTLERAVRLEDSRAVIVLGPSGSGKSSLVRAGVLPRLKKDPARWVVVPPFRHRGAPFRELARALAAAGDNDAADIRDAVALLRDRQTASVRALVEVVDKLAAGSGAADTNVLLFADQFEEFLVADDTAEATDFLALIAAGLARAHRLVVLATLRAEYLGQLQEHPGLAELQGFEDLRLQPMPAARFPEVIEGPAARVGLDLEPGLSVRIALEAAHDDALPLLAFVLRELYERCKRAGTLTLDAYETSLGGMDGAVARRAEAVAPPSKLGSQKMALLRAAFLRMADVGKDGTVTRRAIRAADLDPEAAELVNRFVDARLVVSRGPGGERELEVAHEALFRVWPTLCDWLREETDFLRWRRRVRVRRIEFENDAGELLRGTPLAEAKAWVERNSGSIDKAERDFIAKSARASRRRTIGVFAAAGVILIAVLSLSAALFHLGKEAETNASILKSQANQLRNEAEKREAQAEMLQIGSVLSSAAQAEDPLLGVLLLGELGDTQAIPRFGMRLARKVISRPAPTVVLTASEFSLDGGSFSPDGKWLLSTHHGSARLNHVDSGTGGFWLLDAPIVVFLDGGARIASIGRAGMVRVYESGGDGQPILTRTAPGEAALAARLIGDELVVLLATTDKEMRLWRPFRDRDAGVTITGHTGQPDEAAISEDGAKVVVSVREQAWAWQLNEPTNPRALVGHTGPINQVSFSPEGKHILTCAQDDTAKIWSLDRDKKPIDLLGHDRGVTHCVFGPKGWTVATGSWDSTIRYWDYWGRGGKAAKVLRGHARAIESLAFDRSGTRLLSSSRDGTARLWTVKGNRDEVVFRHGRGVGYEHLGGAGFSPDERHIFTAAGDGTARIWPIADGADPQPLTSNVEELGRLAVAQDGAQIVASGKRGSMRVWSLRSEQEPIDLGTPTDKIVSVGWSDPGAWVATANHGTVRIFRADGRIDSVELISDTVPVTNVQVSRAMRFALIIGGESHQSRLSLWDLQDPARPIVSTSHRHASIGVLGRTGSSLAVAWESPYPSVTFWPNPRTDNPPATHRFRDHVRITALALEEGLIAIGREDGAIWLLRPGHDSEPFKLGTHAQAVNSVSLADGGRRLVSASRDGRVRDWNLRDSEQGNYREIEHRWGEFVHAESSADGSKIVVTSLRQGVDVVNATGKRTNLPGYTNSPRNAMFSPDGRHVIATDYGERVLVWPVDGESMFTPIRTHERTPSNLAFSDDGRRVLTASVDWRARIWSLNDGEKPIAELVGHEGELLAAQFGPDGKKVLTASVDGTARVWPLDGRSNPRILGGSHGPWQYAEFSRDGTRLVSVGEDGLDVRVWDLTRPGGPLSLAELSSQVSAAHFSFDGRRLVTVGDSSNARVWSIDDGSPIAWLATDATVVDAEFSPDGSSIATASENHTVRLWDPATGDETEQLGKIAAGLLQLEFDPDGRQLAAVDNQGNVHLWYLTTDQDPVVLQGNGVRIADIAFTPDGNTLVTAGSDGVARAWDLTWKGLVRRARESVNACLSVEQRTRYLLESPEQAESNHQACERDRLETTVR